MKRLVSLSLFVFGVFVQSFLPKYSKFISHRASNRSLLTSASNQPQLQPDSEPEPRHGPQQQDQQSEALWQAQQEAYAFYQKLRAYNDPSLAPAVHFSLDVLANALRLYGPQRVVSSFNGGKDAVVVMHLLRAAVAKYSHDQHLSTGSNTIIQPSFIYFAITEEFPEVLSFIQQTEARFQLQLLRYDCGIIQGLERYIHSLSDPNPIVAFVLGTRAGDSNAAGQDVFCPSSLWMPVPFMRVNPILKWSYGQVWKFLRDFELPYCSLYDEGYTSLGKTSDTLPNPYLRRKEVESSQEDRYWPAHMLADWTKERAGRGSGKGAGSLPNSPSASIKADSSSSSSSSASASTKESTPEPLQTDGESALAAASAAMIVIGDEILDGSVNETNMQVAAKLFGSIGISLDKVSIIGDDIEEIAAEVRLFSQRFDVVITSGGVGPTHDDVTIKGVAAAFDQQLQVHQEMLNYLREMQQSSSNTSTPRSLHDSSPGSSAPAAAAAAPEDEHLSRLATLPTNARLRFPPSSTTDDKPYQPMSSPVSSPASSPSKNMPKVWPILQCENVFVLPGIPKYFATKMPIIVKHFLRPLGPIRSHRRIALSIEEKDILALLDDIVQRYPTIKFGSYPFVDRLEYKTVITMSASDAQLVEIAHKDLIAALPAHAIVSSTSSSGSGVGIDSY
jgi:FAD synthetase